jgi:hypothetical protein
MDLTKKIETFDKKNKKKGIYLYEDLEYKKSSLIKKSKNISKDFYYTLKGYLIVPLIKVGLIKIKYKQLYQ